MRTEAAKMTLDDATLVRQCRQGAVWAMERLIVKYQDRIYNTILRICGNPDDAAELTQDTFVKVLEKINDFGGRSSFYTWLFRIAVNLTLNYCKRRVRLGSESLDAQLADGAGTVKNRLRYLIADDKAVDAVKVAQDKELCELVLKSLDRLDEDHKAVVVLRDIEGMSYGQIARVLDIELGTVKSRLSRARNNLREIIETVLK
ncbi:MAG: sigma-70 family RNA polymerase sigma factor [Planctomycetota bacterium]